ncbi:Serine/threonine-protein kinase RAD53 [Cyphellophora attinorum]|uniref:non-specific serine/threonine protein kinase n=1 Tax=Cyphellophora attinorum TaxID=1664694 RepID=A0A0N0NRH4_9EURO|nr:Serine/threonine-protein kinase RAD53 [Phialophora attinorum]KPI45091.1 Serine/threonine-protein kinase RAD53 [Phialophora attinorum]
MKGATQPQTQPLEDGRNGNHLSDVSNDDLTDVICLLNPQSTLAHAAVRATMLSGPQHIHQNDDLEGLTDFDIALPQYQEPREFALRLSSTVKSPRDGFVFGRNPDACDLLLTDDPAEKLISNKHFKIHVNSHGSLMLQDMSTNGTFVDDQHLRARRRDAMQKSPSLALKSGTIISVVGGGQARAETKFLVRIPNRGSFEDEYERNLRRYLELRGTVANFASMRESVYGNHWNGGALYNFTGIMGKGAFASVYRVQTKRDGIFYAAKELDKRRFIKNGILDIKFDNELKIMQNLKHPNIVEYIDTQNYENWVYIIMELLNHGELSAELRSRSYLPEAEVQQITRQVLHALYYLHRRGVTHRDIKPDNILIASRDPLIVKLGDFGLSKCVTDQETFLKTFCGTLLYCAPEVYPDYNSYAQGALPKRRRIGEAAAKASPYDESVDMWSFGAVVFHLLCGKAPITGRGDDRGAQMLSNIMTKDVDFEPLRRQGVSAAGIDFVAGLLNRDPLARPKEPECLRHQWLRDVPDILEYDEDDSGAELFRRALDAVDEAPEDEINEAMLQQLSQYAEVARAGGADDVHYPSLPTGVGSSMLDTVPPLPQARLFGEITPSVLKSSGVFGAPLAIERGTTPGEVEDRSNVAQATRAIQHGLENISVNDWRSRYSDDTDMSHADFPLPPGRALAAPSLLGAEAQIGDLNMASGSAALASNNAKTSHDGGKHIDPALLPSGAQSRPPIITTHATKQNPGGDIIDNENIPPTREANDGIDVSKGTGHVVSPRRKAVTFQGQETSYEGLPPLPLAQTMDTTPKRGPGTRNPSQEQSPVVKQQTGLEPGMGQYGCLTSVPGSYINVTIPLLRRETAWGRSPACTQQHYDTSDVCIARMALKIHFHSRGVEEVEQSGGDWTMVEGIEALVSTSTSTYIRINDVKLRKSTDDGHDFLFGKIYDGDVITVADETQADGRFLKLKAEILIGDSARPRPDDEAGFQIQQIRTEKWKEHLAAVVN